jgi:hypothetical protein
MRLGRIAWPLHLIKLKNLAQNPLLQEARKIYEFAEAAK